MSEGRRGARPIMLAAALVAAPGLARAGPLDLYYERAVMVAADDRCELFSPEVGSALAAGAAQARGAALRAGIASATIRRTADEARDRAGLADCRSRDIALAAGRVREAFAAFARVGRLTYPGDLAGWSADRTGGPDLHWRLQQQSAFGPDRMTFGLAGREGQGLLVAVARFADGRTPYAARLLLRDDRRSTGPYLARRTAGPTGRLPLESRLPPRSALRGFTAEARSPAGVDLLAKGEAAGWAFRFPVEAAMAMSALDPRESVAVEFLFPGEQVRRAYVEVGDFAAGRAFVRLARR